MFFSKILCILVIISVFNDYTECKFYEKIPLLWKQLVGNVEKLKSAPKPLCNEHEFLVHLSELYISSPERILLLLTADSPKFTCHDVNYVTKHLTDIQQNCYLDDSNLYKRFAKGLEFYKKQICREGIETPVKREMGKLMKCLYELRDEFLECEGAPDWFEGTAELDVCSKLVEISDCYYLKTALLTDVQAANAIRDFSGKLMDTIVMFHCPMPKGFPVVKKPSLLNYINQGTDLRSLSNLFFISYILFVCFLNT